MFPLQKEPVSMQLTVHINNYDVSRGDGAFVRDYMDCIGEQGGYHRVYNSIVANIIDYYGCEAIDEFIMFFKSDKRGSKWSY